MKITIISSVKGIVLFASEGNVQQLDASIWQIIGCSQKQVQLTVLPAEQGPLHQAVNIVAVNGHAIDPVQTQITVTVQDQVSLTLLMPALFFNFRQSRWQETLTGSSLEQYQAVKDYFTADVSDQCSITLPGADHFTPEQLQYFKEHNNHATLFIHGYSIAPGTFAQIQNNLTCDLYRTPAKTENGSGAHYWLLNMEHNLNVAMGFSGQDYRSYKRIVAINWQGNPTQGYDYLAAMPMSDFAATKTLELIAQLTEQGIGVTVIAHSLGNAVLLSLLQQASEQEINIARAICWEGAVPNTVFSAQQTPLFTDLPFDYFYPKAYQGSEQITVLHSKDDNILGEMPIRASDHQALLSAGQQGIKDFFLALVSSHPHGLLSTLKTHLKKAGLWFLPHEDATAQLLGRKLADPQTTLAYAIVAEAFYYFDHEVAPKAKLAHGACSIYYMANAIGYPLSYFLQAPSAHAHAYYHAWQTFYHVGESTLAAQQAMLSQEHGWIYDLCSVGVDLVLHLQESKQTDGDAVVKVILTYFSHWEHDQHNTLSHVRTEARAIAALLVTIMLTPTHTPQALGYTGCDPKSIGHVDNIDQIDEGTLLPDHDGMLYPSKAFMKKIYEQGLALTAL